MRALDPGRVALTGTTLIEASAGTGKTYTITTLALRLVVEAELSVDQVLIVTYTRAATAELRDRLRARFAVALRAAQGAEVRDDFVAALVERARTSGTLSDIRTRLERALHDLDQAPVLTIHGFCQRALSDHAFESGASTDVQLTSHAAPLLEEIADDYYVSELSAAPPERVQALDANELERLRFLSTRATQELTLLPREVPPETFDFSAWNSAYTECARLYAEDRAVIEKLATIQAKGQARHVPKWANQLASLFVYAEPGQFVHDDNKAAIKYFSTAASTSATGASRALHPFFEAAERLRQEDAAYVRASGSTKLSFRRGFLRYAGRELSVRTQKLGVRTFDALLRDLDEALSAPHHAVLLKALRSDYRAALVDEFQDTDPVQYRIFRRIFHGFAPLFLIGDPKQAIYGFRGADVFAYMAARNDAGEQSYTLDVNRRSDTELVAALNTLYGSVTQPFALEGIDYVQVSTPRDASNRFRARDGGAPLEVLVVDGEKTGETLRKDLAERTASEIVRLLRSHSERLDDPVERRFRVISPSDIAVLCRSNREAQLVQEALRERRVPSVFQGDESVLGGDDAVEIERVLRALAHPGDVRALRSFLSSSYGGHDAKALMALESDDRAWDRHRAIMTELSELWLAHGFIQALRGLVLAYDVERTLLLRPDGPRRLTNLWHLGEILSDAALSQRLGPLGLIRFLMLVRSDETARAELVGDAEELRLESSADAVRLTTIHKSKGLEYPVVFLPFTWDARHVRGEDKNFVRFHDGASLMLDLGSDEIAEHRLVAEREGLAESLRLLYVGLTRARHRVVVFVPSQKNLEKSALGYTLLGGSPGGLPVASPTEPTALLARLQKHEGERIAVRLSAEPTLDTLPARTGEAGLSVRTMRRVVDAQHRTSSFSGLTSHARGEHVMRGVDHDAVAVEEKKPAPSTLVLDAFPRGAGPGQLVHEVLELCDFTSSAESIGAVVHEVLSARGYPLEFESTLTRGLVDVLSTPLNRDGLTLSSVPREKRLDELEFLLPVTASLTPKKLEQTLKAHGAPQGDPSYAQRLRNLTFESMRGFLRGFIDLVFESDGRFYLVDYKSNHLGPRAEDYTGESLAEAMAEHHYHLQYHLYVVALHRYLSHRLPDYDYEAHFGGVYYLFLRGMAPAHEPGSGIYAERPTRALVDALDALFRMEAP